MNPVINPLRSRQQTPGTHNPAIRFSGVSAIPAKRPLSQSGLASASYVTPQILFGYDKKADAKAFAQWVEAERGITDLKDFQRESVEHLAAGKSVVAATPTSSGKTLIAEYAVWDVLLNGNNPGVLHDKVFYTTPRKALSNEKYEDFVQQYGADNVGLMTGDTTINRDAPVLVMTTEVLRNLFYDHEENADLLNDLKYFVLDECHFIDEPYRGMVWEETIMNAPKGVQQIHLSATIDNADQYTRWVNHLGATETELAPMVERPVPLTKLFMTPGDRPRLVSIFHDSGQENKAFQKAFRAESAYLNPVHTVKRLYLSDKLPAILFKFSRRGCAEAAELVAGYAGFKKDGGRRQVVEDSQPKATTNGKNKRKKRQRKNHDRNRRQGRHHRNDEVRVGKIQHNQQHFMTTPEEQAKITAIIDRYVEEYPWLIYSSLLTSKSKLDEETFQPEDPDDNMLTRGVAPHHGGMLPAERKLVETLLREGLLKAVFATDTLAAGMNVPAKSVVLTQYDRMQDGVRDIISNSDYLQITGRAGRLGMYDRGYAIHPHPGALMTKKEFTDFVSAESNDVHSQLEVNPNFVIQTMSRLDTNAEVKDYLSRSFLMHQLREKIDARRDAEDVKTRMKKDKLEVIDESFRIIKSALIKYEFLDGNSKPTKLGHIAKNVFNDHDLVLAMALESELFINLEPSELAGLMSIFIARAKDDNTMSDPLDGLPTLNEDSIQAMALSLRGVEDGMKETIGHTPESMSGEYYYIIRNWAEAGDQKNAWVQQIMGSKTHEPGDILDVMRRTANLLRQIADLPDLTQAEMAKLKTDDPVLISADMKAKAAEAAALLMRDEVLEQVTPNPIELPDFSEESAL